MDDSTVLNGLVEAKRRRRTELAQLPYPDKVRIVVELQKMQAPILAARGIHVRVWDIYESPGVESPTTVYLGS